jgi:hypothetical protein
MRSGLVTRRAEARPTVIWSLRWWHWSLRSLLTSDVVSVRRARWTSRLRRVHIVLIVGVVVFDVGVHVDGFSARRRECVVGD